MCKDRLIEAVLLSTHNICFVLFILDLVNMNAYINLVKFCKFVLEILSGNKNLA